MTEAAEAIRQLTEAGASLAQRGWLLGTSGNLSATLDYEPLRLIITASGQDKGRLSPASFIEVDGDGHTLNGDGHPSAETSLHRVIVHRKKAGSVLHVHSTWATVLSGLYAEQGGIAITGYEMLKGLSGIKTHEHTEWLPILENSQDYEDLSARLDAVLVEHPGVHGVLLRGHGIYTWGTDVNEAQRHVEILEFLLEVIGKDHLIREQRQ
ncbi:MAG TPA: methylthioribulose 1-phosphate dehydratase [Silvibacterium sp.]|nr:methylthioribulose 1-phosphate dehydratase [Silvibacterium sp.]